MSEEGDQFALRLGKAAIGVWGDIPRDLQEALFETALRGRDDLRPASRGCCMTGIPAQNTPRSPPDLETCRLQRQTVPIHEVTDFTNRRERR
jgi:hypothetical protein